MTGTHQLTVKDLIQRIVALTEKGKLIWRQVAISLYESKGWRLGSHRLALHNGFTRSC